MKIIAVDFDGCLCGGKWPDIGAPRQQVINELIRQQAEGAKLILWSCREGEQLKAAVMWCLNHGLKFDAVNDNLEENKAYFGNNSRKIYATEYWDDKSVLVSNSDNATTIVRREYQTGGLSIKSWQRTSVKVVGVPDVSLCKPGEIAVIPAPYQSAWERLKGWWKKWRSA